MPHHSINRSVQQTLLTKNSVIIDHSTTEYISERIANQLINSLTYLLAYLLIYLLTNYMQHIVLEKPTFVWNSKVHCCVHRFLFRPRWTQSTPFYPICIKHFFFSAILFPIYASGFSVDSFHQELRRKL